MRMENAPEGVTSILTNEVLLELPLYMRRLEGKGDQGDSRF
jgi:hypothetical protein